MENSAEGKIEEKLEKLEEKMDSKIESMYRRHTDTCPLNSYKGEMYQKWERLLQQMSYTKEALDYIKVELEEKVDLVKKDAEDDYKSVKNLGRVLVGVLVTVGLFYGGILGTLQIEKVGREEFQNHLTLQTKEQDKITDRFQQFLSLYREERNSRNNKLDNILNRQGEFNTRLLNETGEIKESVSAIKVRVLQNTKTLER